ncbi:hypothetical protein Cgig2_017916 [Carnegiea gigantea]|uniref:Sodium/calcium exchanger membrane region domain-containing protein n=1 Tax=Carnegiea gigantea TaxID=171969 RepID=A0A9Q1QCV5_9CARY|nr:hypothetical protein Cgig2_017916 [Carnegiea gigantea]
MPLSAHLSLSIGNHRSDPVTLLHESWRQGTEGCACLGGQLGAGVPWRREKLSDLLKLSPTFVGVTLLPFGNGASDVFAVIANFVSSGSNDIGFDGILGGAILISYVVGGVVSFNMADKKIQVDRRRFIRDLSFFLFGVVWFALILVNGEMNIWGVVAFLSISMVYAFFVTMNEILKRKASKLKLDGLTPMLHVVGSFFSCRGEEDDSIHALFVSPDSRASQVDISVKLPH